MEALTEQLLNNFQHDFPLSSRPFSSIASVLRTDTDAVLSRFRELQAQGVVSRVGVVFRPNTVGASTLAAVSVPAGQLADVAAQVSRFDSVNHNYEREHDYNLWFVVTADSATALDNELQRIESAIGYRLLRLPLVRDYHIDLGFPMQLDKQPEPLRLSRIPGNSGTRVSPSAATDSGTRLDAGNSEDLIAVIQDGLPLVPRPYLAIGRRLGWTERQVIAALRRMIDGGVIKRLGVIVRHHELGYRANAMVVWDVPDDVIDEIGPKMGQQECVTLCYQRPRSLPDWPYNLFCMVHGRNRDAVRDCIARMTDRLGLQAVPHAVLFSGRRFKQRGARYRGGAGKRVSAATRGKVH